MEDELTKPLLCNCPECKAVLFTPLNYNPGMDIDTGKDYLYTAHIFCLKCRRNVKVTL